MEGNRKQHDGFGGLIYRERYKSFLSLTHILAANLCALKLPAII
jgi:hypothetical protein